MRGTPYDSFWVSQLGQRILPLIEDPGRYREFAVLSRLGIPAVAALVDELLVLDPTIVTNGFAKQAIGAKVVRDQHRHLIVRPKARVPGGLFTYGAVYSKWPAGRAAPVSPVSPADAA
jgi:hypothetical protein